MASEVQRTTIFQKTGNWDFAERVFTVDMLRVLSAVDGCRDLFEISGELELSQQMLAIEIKRLLDYGLIETAVDEKSQARSPKQVSHRPIYNPRLSNTALHV